MIYSEFLDIRKNTFEKSYELILKNMKENITYNIVELGSSRSYVNGGHEGCCSARIQFWRPNEPHIWDWGAGIFTRVFAENLKDKNYKLYTIDPNEYANIITTNMCADYNNVIVLNTYSSDFIDKFNEKIDFLYMDHMETSEEAAILHLKDIETIINKNLMSDNGIILIDDVGHDTINGKGKYSIPFLLKNNYKMIIHEYQVLLMKA